MNSQLAHILLDPDSPAPSPCFVIDMPKLRSNAEVLAGVQERTGARILLALKGYAAWATFDALSAQKNGPLHGVCASSVDEARLGREEFGGEVHAFAAAWSEAEMRELLPLVDHITFNSLAQWRKFRSIIAEYNASGPKPILCGLRLNPEYSEGRVPIYDPCAPGSRLGIRHKNLASFTADDFVGLTGAHFHTLCEQDADALARTLREFERRFTPLWPDCSWLNWGGGHHITRPGYDLDLLETMLKDWVARYGCQIYLEPGEAVALNAGWLTCTVLDIVEADMPVAILDTSAACHMPDVMEMPYRPNVWQNNKGEASKAGEPGEFLWSCRLAGKSCLAGDIIGEYSFKRQLEPGDRLAFADMAIYSMVKTTTFNGLRLPSIGIYDNIKEPAFRIIRNFDYEDFRNRLS